MAPLLDEEGIVNANCAAQLKELRTLNHVKAWCHGCRDFDITSKIGGAFFDHFVYNNAQWIGTLPSTEERIGRFDTAPLKAKIDTFLRQHPGHHAKETAHGPLVLDISNPPDDAAVEFNAQLSFALRTMVIPHPNLVVVDGDGTVGIFRKQSLGLAAIKLRDMQRDWVHVVVTSGLGEQSLAEAGDVVLSVGYASEIKSADDLAKIFKALSVLPVAVN